MYSCSGRRDGHEQEVAIQAGGEQGGEGGSSSGGSGEGRQVLVAFERHRKGVRMMAGRWWQRDEGRWPGRYGKADAEARRREAGEKAARVRSSVVFRGCSGTEEYDVKVGERA